MPMILNLLDRMKLPFRRNKELVTALHDILGFYPHQVDIYRTALSHRSITAKRTTAADGDRRRKARPEANAKPLHNERLEFLGDAVLESVVSDIVFHHFPYKREGFLTSTRSKIVQRESLNRLAQQMGLEKLILAAQGTRMIHTNIGGNAFEALMGAIYLDRGYKHCLWFITHRVLGPYLDLDGTAKKEVNFKSKLLEWSQKNRISTTFKDSATENKGFRTTVVVEDIVMGRGSGRSKKESQQEAAKNALMLMRKDPKSYDSLFRAKEKRTAMEADESFALPKIDEIEELLANPAGTKDSARRTGRNASPKQAETEAKLPHSSDEAYDAAYDEQADYEIIDTPHDEQPHAPANASREERNAETGETTKPRQRRNKGRGAKAYADVIKGHDFAAAMHDTPEEDTDKDNEDSPYPSPKAPAPQTKKPNAAPKQAENNGQETSQPRKPKKEQPNAPANEKPARETKPQPARQKQNADRKAAEGEKVLTTPDGAQALPQEKPDNRSKQPSEQAEESLIVVQDLAPLTPIDEETAPEHATAPALFHDEEETGTPAPQSVHALISEQEFPTGQPSITAFGNLSKATEDDAPAIPERKVKERTKTGTHSPVTPTQAISRPTEADTAPMPQHATPAGQEADTFRAANEHLQPRAEASDEPSDSKQPASPPASLQPDAPLPILRHLSLDEFVFGSDETAPDSLPETSGDEADGNSPSPKARRNPRRRSRKPRTDKEQPDQADEGASVAAPSDSQETEQTQAPRNRKSRRRRKPSATAQTEEKRDENGEKAVPKLAEPDQ